jgi:hypothetical protein
VHDPAALVMTIQGRATFVLVGLIGIALVWRWLAQQRLGYAYAVLWFGIFAGMLTVAAFPALVIYTAALVGLQEHPDSLLRVSAFGFIFVMLLYMSAKTSDLQRRLNALVQTLALRDATARHEAPPADREA